MKHTFTLRLGAIALATGLLAACGGGGSSGNSYPSTMTAAKMADLLASHTWETACLRNPDPAPGEGAYLKAVVQPQRLAAPPHALGFVHVVMDFDNATCAGKYLDIEANDVEHETLIYQLGEPVKNSKGQWASKVKMSWSDPSNNESIPDNLITLTSATSFVEHDPEAIGEAKNMTFTVSKANYAQLLKEAQAAENAQTRP